RSDADQGCSRATPRSWLRLSRVPDRELVITAAEGSLIRLDLCGAPGIERHETNAQGAVAAIPLDRVFRRLLRRQRLSDQRQEQPELMFVERPESRQQNGLPTRELCASGIDLRLLGREGRGQQLPLVSAVARSGRG